MISLFIPLTLNYKGGQFYTEKTWPQPVPMSDIRGLWQQVHKETGLLDVRNETPASLITARQQRRQATAHVECRLLAKEICEWYSFLKAWGNVFIIYSTSVRFCWTSMLKPFSPALFQQCWNMLNRSCIDVEWVQKRLKFASTTIQHFFCYCKCPTKLTPSFNIVRYALAH